jgi:hypothetical protein
MAEVCHGRRFDDPPITVVVHPATLLTNGSWMKAVAADERGRRTVFVQDAAEPWIHVRKPGAPELTALPEEQDLAAACAVLSERGISGPRRAVQALVPGLTLPEPLAAAATDAKVQSPEELATYIASANEASTGPLVEQLRSPIGVMPFVGAGMTVPFGYPMWGPFLRDIAAQFDVERDVEAELGKGKYEAAAAILDRYDSKQFRDAIRHRFRQVAKPADLLTGAISYLPLLTDGPIITTNFDPVVEDAIRATGVEPTVIDGPREEPIVSAVHRNERAVLKIHGTYNDATFRVLTQAEYERGYVDGQVTLASLAWLMFTNRPLLFLGCSLETDRTTHALADIQKVLPGLRHVAVLAAHHVRSVQVAREKQLSDWGIVPVWYPPGEFARIEGILRDLVERAATRSEQEPSSALRRPRFAGSTRERLDAVVVPPAARSPETSEVAEAIRAGRVAFFLGAYAHLGRLPLGNDFYDRLARKFDCPELAGDRSAVAAFVTSRRGPGVLWREVKAMLAAPIAAGPVHQLVTAIPSFRRSLGSDRPTWIFTTNYDTIVERELTTAGEPYHLVYYMEEEGLFAHTDPDGAVRVIERPEAIRTLDGSATVVVKLNGGIVSAPPPRESVVIASGQFERLASRLPEALPACVTAALRERSLLFLGHGLREPDVRRLIECFAGGDDRHSWAVQLPPGDPRRQGEWRDDVRWFEDRGLHTIVRDLEEFLADLTARLRDTA